VIAKHVPPKGSTKSSFNRLVDYISDEQDKVHRVGLVKSVNCHAATIDAAITEVLATQQQNTRATGDKTYHLLVSFREGEAVDNDTLSKIEAQLCEAIGFGEHQRISAVHRDTDNLHIHIAINKIHPEKLTMVEPFGAYRVLGETCEQLENQYGLEKDNHITKQREGQSRAQDMEAHSGQKSLISWTREQCGEALESAQSWEDVHHVLKEHGLHMQRRGSGLVITSDNDVSIKASSVSRALSKPALEKRLGEFVVGEVSQGQEEGGASTKSRYSKQPIELKIDTSVLYQRYQQQTLQSEQHVNQALASVMTTKGRKLKALDLANKLKRLAISQETNFITRKMLYKLHFNAVKRQRQKIQQTAASAKSQVYGQHRKLTWADWLKQQAQQGDNDALTVLQARQPHRQQQCNSLSGQYVSTLDSAVLTGADNITKKGSVIDKHTGVKETANSLVLPLKVTTTTLIEALKLAQVRYGNIITINGDDAFKQRIIEVAVNARLNIQFAGGAERDRLQLEERYNGKSREDGRGITGRGNDGSGRALIEHNGSRRRDERKPSQSQRQPNVGSIGSEPPPSRRHGLRNVSELSVASLKGQGAVLLPRDVSGDVGQQRSGNTADALRWGIFGARLDEVQVSAAEQYIRERMSKRDKGIDVAIHEPLTQVVKGQFAGSRFVNGQLLLLVKIAPDVISVLPIKSDVRRLKIGDEISINGQAKVSRVRGLER